jgi:hypothetical protein
MENPPSGVLAYYWLGTAAKQPLKLELLDNSGSVRASAASDTQVKAVDMESLSVQAIWVQPAQPPSADAGMHRYALGGAGGRRGGASGLPPGEYTVRLTVDGQTYSQPVTVKPDPRGGT